MNFGFPKDFMFGAACSAVQIESGLHEGGKGKDVTQHFFPLRPDKYLDGDPENSADFYHKYPEDIKNMKELGLKAFRFTISWSRIFPDGPDKVCQAGLDYYSDVIDKLKEAGIITFFDLFHSDLPLWVYERGGIHNTEFVEWFTIYAETVFKALGHKVDYWCTVNEPSINCMSAYAYGTHPPFLTDMKMALEACHNMLLAHYKAVRIYKDLGFKGKIGAVIHFQPVYALTMDKKDWEAAERDMEFYSGWWLDAMLKGHYPENLLKYPYITDMLPENYQEEMDKFFIENDFIGINYYNPAYAEYADDGKLYYKLIENDKLPKDDYGFICYPQGMYDTAMYLHETYPGKEIIFTENGIGIKKWGNYEEELVDDYRIDYMSEHLRSLSRACKAGAPVKGYFHWSIMDTNELSAGGYTYMFGLNQVRYDTLERIPRKSWYYYQKVIKEEATY